MGGVIAAPAVPVPGGTVNPTCAGARGRLLSLPRHDKMSQTDRTVTAPRAETIVKLAPLWDEPDRLSDIALASRVRIRSRNATSETFASIPTVGDGRRS